MVPRTNSFLWQTCNEAFAQAQQVTFVLSPRLSILRERNKFSVVSRPVFWRSLGLAFLGTATVELHQSLDLTYKSPPLQNSTHDLHHPALLGSAMAGPQTHDEISTLRPLPTPTVIGSSFESVMTSKIVISLNGCDGVGKSKVARFSITSESRTIS
jgi:hypothetical protein